MKLDASNDLTYYRENAWREVWPLVAPTSNASGFTDYKVADYLPFADLVDFGFEHRLNYTISSAIFRRHPSIIWTAVATYITFVFVGPRMMRNRPAFNLKRSLTLWNLALAVFSIYGTFRVLPHLIYGHLINPPTYFVCRNIGGHSVEDNPYFWGTLFLWSKIAEFIDTAFLVLRKKPVIFLHWFHHVTVSLYCWYSWAFESNTSIYFCAMNYLVHSIMYTYYFLMSIGKTPSWGLLVTLVQVAQMFIGIFINVFQYYASTQQPNCDVSWPMLLAATVMYAIYLVLFLQFFADKYYFSRQRKHRSTQRSSSFTSQSKQTQSAVASSSEEATNEAKNAASQNGVH